MVQDHVTFVTIAAVKVFSEKEIGPQIVRFVIKSFYLNSNIDGLLKVNVLNVIERHFQMIFNKHYYKRYLNERKFTKRRFQRN